MQTYLLSIIAHASTNPVLAQVLLAGPSSQVSAGAKIEAAKAANLINSNNLPSRRWLPG